MTTMQKVLCTVALFVMTLFLGVGYASVTNPLSISGTVETTPPDTIAITNITRIGTSNVSGESNSCIFPTNIKSSISGSAGQKVVYRITVYNYSKTNTYVYNGIEYDTLFGNALDKMSISVSSDQAGSNNLPVTPQQKHVAGTAIEPGEEYTFYAVYTLKENVSGAEVLIHYSFDPIIYSVTYLDNNEVYAEDCIIDNSSVYQVRTDHPTVGYEGKSFAGWMNANAVVVESYPAGNTTSYTLTSKWDSIYTIMFVDKDGNVLYQEQFTSASTELSASGQVEVNKILSELNAAASMSEMTVTWSDYTIKGATADIVVRPNYTYHSNLQYKPVDTDGDGVVDYYKVVAISGLDANVTILGELNGRPVETVEKLYDNDGNLDYNSAVKTIVINEGVKTLQHNSLSHTKNLKTVYLPNSLEYLDKNVFSRNWGDDKKVITIYYNGTMDEWKNLVANSHNDWDNGITTKDGSKVICSDGYFEFDYGFLGIGSKWNEHPN